MKAVSLTVLLALNPLPEARAAQATIIYAPEGSQTQEGNSFLLAPLVPNGGPRFQQVFNSSIFTPLLPPGGGWITDIAFRADGPFGGNFNFDVPNVQVILSTTTHSADGLSSIFDDNLGPDQAVVFGAGPLHIRSTHNPLDYPQGFALIFGLSQPFYYNPSAGNLLMDIRSLYAGQETYPQVFLDAVNTPGDSISALGGGAPTTAGLATFIAFQPVPEPSSLTLCVIGSVLLAMGWKRMRKAKAH